MGLNNEGSRSVILDIETAPLLDAEQYLEEPTAPSNYVKPEAIANYIAKAKAEALAKCALDLDLCRIVAIGVLEVGNDLELVTCHDEDDEADSLEHFWHDWPYGTTFIGYNILSFDLTILLRRSLYLGVKTPVLQLDKYKHPYVIDLMQILSNNWAQKFRGLAFYARRFGLPLPVEDGANVPAWVASGEWEKVESHLRGDLQTTAALAQKLGVWQSTEWSDTNKRNYPHMGSTF